MKLTYRAVFLMSLCFFLFSDGRSYEELPVASNSVLLSEVLGACNGDTDNELWDYSLGWLRVDLPWHLLEPEPGHWDSEFFDKWIARYVEPSLRRGVKVLPVLGYNADWSYRKDVWTYSYGDKTYTYKYLGNDKYKRSIQEKGRALVSEEVVTGRRQFPIAKSNIERWKSYIQKVVARLSVPPYNIEFFQVWNEAHPKSGFWSGDLDDYMRDIHLPAAEVIHSQGEKVVYGGWPLVGQFEEFMALMKKHEALSSVDVYSFHYRPVDSFERIYTRLVKEGIRNPSIWQTEIGFSSDRMLLPTTFVSAINWFLSVPGLSKDQFKLFWYAQGSPNSPEAYGYGKTLLTGKELSPHGVALKVLGEVFSGKEIQSYSPDSIHLGPALQDAKLVHFYVTDLSKLVIGVFPTAKGFSNSSFAENGWSIVLKDSSLLPGNGVFAEVLDVRGRSAALSDAAVLAGDELRIDLSEARQLLEDGRNGGSGMFFITVSLLNGPEGV